MLCFNPNERQTAEELLEHPYFADIGQDQPQTQLSPPSKVDLPFEKKAWIGFVEIRQLILQEIDYYRSLDNSRFKLIKEATEIQREDLKIENLGKISYKL